MNGFSNTLRSFWRAVYLVSTISFFISDLSVVSKFTTLLIVAGLVVITEIEYSRLVHNSNLRFVYSFVAAYLAFAYTGKFAALIYLLEKSWLSSFAILGKISYDGFFDAYLLSALGVLAMTAGFMVGGKFNYSNRYPIKNSRYTLALVIVLLLILRFSAVRYLDIGVPGKRPIELGIPFLTGIIAFLTGNIVFMLINVYLYLQIYFRDKNGSLGLASLFVMANLFLDLSVGYKQVIVYQCVVLVSYYYVFRHMFSSNERRTFRYSVLILVSFTLIIYGYINYFRFALLDGENLVAALSVASRYESISESNVLLDIGNRINGIDNFYAAMVISEGRNFSVSAILDDELVRAFVSESLGDDAVTSFGLTQFGALFAVGGSGLLIAGGFMIGKIIRFMTYVNIRYFISSAEFVPAYIPVLSLFFIKFLFAGGQILLYAKEIALTMFVILFLSRSLTSKSSGAC